MPTQLLFQGRPIVVFPNDHLASVDSTHFPMIFGALTAAADFMDYENLLFRTSEEYGFDKNQTYMRVLEAFDVVSTDTGAYIYATFSASV